MEKRMQRKGFVAVGWLAVLLGIWCGPLCGPSWSAPPVQRFSRPITSDPYPEAAAEFGFREWGGEGGNPSLVRATARLDAERLRLTIELPPGTPLAGGERWLQGLSDAMGWQDPTLSSNLQPEALYLRADVRQVVRKRGFGRSEAHSDAALLAAELRKLSPRPVLLGIRLVGAELETASTPPVATGRSGGHTFLFYRLSDFNPGSGALSLQYGLPQRWLAAGAAGLLLWLLFPPLALYAVRSYLAGQAEIEPRQRLLLYRRWQRGVLVVPTALALGAMLLGRFWFLGYFGTGFALATPMLIILPGLLFGLTARLIGIPLERAAWPQRAELPWYRLASTELWLGGMVLVGVTVGGFMASSTLTIGVGAAASRPLLPLLFPAALAVGLVTWSAVVNYRRKQGTLPNETDAPAELTEVVRDLTTQLGVPVERVRLAPAREGLMAGTVAVLGSLVLIGKELVENLEEDQVAALIAAAALSRPRTRGDRWLTWGLSFGLLLPFLFLLGASLWSRGGAASNRSLFPLLMLASPLSVAGSFVQQRRLQARQALADFQAAEALGQPHRYLAALRRLEEVQMESGGLGPAAVRTSPLAQRRERLARRLGME